MTRQYQYLFTTLVEPPGGEQVNAPPCIYIYIAAFIYGYDIPMREYRWRSFLTLSPCVCQEQSHSSVLYFSWENNPLSLSLSAIRFGISIEFSFPPPPVRGIYFRRYVSPPSPRLLHCQSDVFIFSGNGIIFAAKEIDLEFDGLFLFFLETFPRGMVFK